MISVGDVFRCDGMAYRVVSVNPDGDASADRDEVLDPLAFKSIRFTASEALEASDDDYAALLDMEGMNKVAGGYSPAWIATRKSQLLAKFNGAGSFWYLPNRHLGRP